MAKSRKRSTNQRKNGNHRLVKEAKEMDDVIPDEQFGRAFDDAIDRIVFSSLVGEFLVQAASEKKRYADLEAYCNERESVLAAQQSREDDYLSLESEKSELETRLVSMEKEIAELRDQKEKAMKLALQTSAEKSHTRWLHLWGRGGVTTDNREEVVSLKNQLHDLSADRDAFSKEKAELKQKCEELELETEKLKKDHGMTTEELEQVKMSLEVTREELERVNGLIGKLETDTAALKAEILDAEMKTAALQSEKDSIEAKSAALQCEKEGIARSLEDEKLKAEAMRLRIAELEEGSPDEVRRFKQGLADQQERIAELTLELERFRAAGADAHSNGNWIQMWAYPLGSTILATLLLTFAFRGR